MAQSIYNGAYNGGYSIYNVGGYMFLDDCKQVHPYYLEQLIKKERKAFDERMRRKIEMERIQKRNREIERMREESLRYEREERFLRAIRNIEFWITGQVSV